MFRSVAGTRRMLAACVHGSGSTGGAGPAARSGTGLTGYGAEGFVDAPQQVDQDFLFALVQAGQQPAFAVEGCDDDLVMRPPSLPPQPDRIAPPPPPIRSDP